MANLDPKPLKEATKIALAALRGPTREQVDRVSGSMWEVDVRKLEALKDGTID